MDEGVKKRGKCRKPLSKIRKRNRRAKKRRLHYKLLRERQEAEERSENSINKSAISRETDKTEPEQVITLKKLEVRLERTLQYRGSEAMRENSVLLLNGKRFVSEAENENRIIEIEEDKTADTTQKPNATQLCCPIRQQKQTLLEITEKFCILCTRCSKYSRPIDDHFEFIKNLCGVNIFKYNIPPKACAACLQMLSIIIDFRNQIMKSDEFLNENLKQFSNLNDLQEVMGKETLSTSVSQPGEVEGEIKCEVEEFKPEIVEEIIQISHDVKKEEPSFEDVCSNPTQQNKDLQQTDFNATTANVIDKSSEDNQIVESNKEPVGKRKPNSLQEPTAEIPFKKCKQTPDKSVNSNIRITIRNTEEINRLSFANEIFNKSSCVQETAEIPAVEPVQNKMSEEETQKEITAPKYKHTNVKESINEKLKFIMNNRTNHFIEQIPNRPVQVPQVQSKNIKAYTRIEANINKKITVEQSKAKKGLVIRTVQLKKNTNSNEKQVVGFISSQQFKDLKNIKQIDGNQAKGKKLVFVGDINLANKATTANKNNMEQAKAANIEQRTENDRVKNLNQRNSELSVLDKTQPDNKLAKPHEIAVPAAKADKKMETESVKRTSNNATQKLNENNGFPNPTENNKEIQNIIDDFMSLSNDDDKKIIILSDIDESPAIYSDWATDCIELNKDINFKETFTNESINVNEENANKENINIKEENNTKSEEEKNESADNASVEPASKKEQSKEVSKMKCEKCKKSFQRYHRCKIDNPTKVLTINKNATWRADNGPALCNACGEVFQTTKDYAEHYHKNHRIMQKCHVCGIMYRKGNHARHMADHNILTEECRVCGKTIRLKWMTLHMRRHGTRLLCTKCGKRFNHRWDLRRHEIIHGEKKHQCRTCPKNFFYIRQLNRHIRSHSGEKPYSCNYCNRKFTLRWNMIQHKRLHTNTFPYKCEACSAEFRHNVTLKKHRAMAHTAKDFVSSDS